MERAKGAERDADAGASSQGKPDPARARTKMASGGEELRDHDFAVERQDARRSPGPVAIDTGAPPLEAERSGGRNGKIVGDKQRAGTVGTIMNQDGSDPDNFTDR